jgi:dTDP-4-amino-4,6-dideoxygalactose transaminase
MAVPFFDIGRLNATIAGEISTAVQRAVGSGWYILGKEGEAFESAMARQLGSGRVLGCNSGTDSLVLSLRAAGVGSGDEVITVAHTAIPTVAAICAVGATPVLVDIDPATWVIDPVRIAQGLTPLTKAVIGVHLYGNMADIDAIQEALHAAGRSDIAIIEDVAQAQGAALSGRSAGVIGRFGSFSFYPSKNIGALGDGGAVACQSDADAERVSMLRNYGQRDRYHAELRSGLNSRLDEIQAAILSAKLPYLGTWNNRKSELMERYRTSLAGLPLLFQQVTAGCEPAWHLCVVALEKAGERDRLQEHLQRHGVQTLVHYPIPNHLQPAFAHARKGDLSVTENLAGRILSLPLSPVLADGEQEQVISSVREFFSV